MYQRNLSLILAILGVLFLTLALTQPSAALATPTLTPNEQLGKALFFDKNLSKNGNQSCATCHDPSVGYTGPDSAINAHGAVYPGSDPALFGNRKPPSAAYAGDSSLLHLRQRPSRLVWRYVLGRPRRREMCWATRWLNKPKVRS